MARVVIIGGGYAGHLAAARLRRSSDAELLLVNPGEAFVERVRLHQAAASGQLARHPHRALLAPIGGRHVQAAAVDVDEDEPVVSLDDGRSLEADAVVLAVGSHSRPGPAGAWTLDRPEDLRAVHAHAVACGELTVVGAGMTGLEVVTELAWRHPGLRLRLVHAGMLPLASSAQERVERRLDALGVEVERRRVEGVDGPTLWCAGFVAPGWLGRLGLPRDGRGRLWVRPDLSVPGRPWLFGAGDAVAVRTPAGLVPRMACATAGPMGVHAADNLLRWLAGEPTQSFRFAYAGVTIDLGGDALFQPSSWDDQPLDWCVAGLPARLAKAALYRYTLLAPALERRGLRGMYWPHPPAERRLAA